MGRKSKLRPERKKQKSVMKASTFLQKATERRRFEILREEPNEEQLEVLNPEEVFTLDPGDPLSWKKIEDSLNDDISRFVVKSTFCQVIKLYASYPGLPLEISLKGEYSQSEIDMIASLISRLQIQLQVV